MSLPTIWPRLAGFLFEQRSAIIDQFAAVVRLDPKIPTADALAKEMVIDHLPQLLESLAHKLQRRESAPHSPAMEKNARAHALHRWEQHYHLHELLREYAVLRQILMFQFARFELGRNVEPDDRLSALRTLHDLLDEAMIASAEKYAELLARAAAASGNPDPILPG